MAASLPALADLLAALAAEDAARAALRDALGRQAVALRALQEQGLVTSDIALKIARARGEPLPLDKRKKLAARFRQRVCRVTRRQRASLVLSADQPGSAPPAPAGTLLRRTVTTEEYTTHRGHAEAAPLPQPHPRRPQRRHRRPRPTS